jgi:two-component system response regulator RegX3
MKDGQDSRARILHVDDDPQIRLLMAGSLHEFGYNVATAGTVKEALQLATGMAFDLFILDVRLPDGTGVELCQVLRRLQPGVPVVYYTGYADEASEREALSKCGDAYLQKPVSISEWEKTISELLARKKPSVM